MLVEFVVVVLLVVGAANTHNRLDHTMLEISECPIKEMGTCAAHDAHDLDEASEVKSAIGNIGHDSAPLLSFPV